MVQPKGKPTPEGVALSEGPPVVLFPSLAGSVLHCHESPVYKDKRIWMGIDCVTTRTADGVVVEMHAGSSSHDVTNPFVQHISLHNGGDDPPGIRVRAKPGLAGCEYLSENALVKVRNAGTESERKCVLRGVVF